MDAPAPIPKPTLRTGGSWLSWAGGPFSSRIGRWSAVASQIERLSPDLETRTNDQLRKESLSLRYRAKSGEPLERLLPEAFALVREAGRRTLNMRHFPV